MSPELIDALQKIIIALIGAVAGIIIKIGTRAPKGRNKEDLVHHSIFEDFTKWRSLKFTTLTTGNTKKDMLLLKYANLLIDTYETLLNDIIKNLSADNVKSVFDMYMSGINMITQELQKSGFPDIFIKRIQESSSITRLSILEQIQKTEDDKSIPYFEKVYLTINQIQLLLDIQINSLKDILIKMNGELDAALK